MVLGLMFVTSQQGTPSRGSSTSSSAQLLRQGETRMYLLGKASRARVREAENARRNRAEILKAWSQGQVSRRDLIKMALALKNDRLAVADLHQLGRHCPVERPHRQGPLIREARM